MKNTYDQDLSFFKKLHGAHAGEVLVEGLKDICPDFATLTIELAFGTILPREGLDIKIHELAIIASCVTLDNAMPQLAAHVEAACNVGAAKEEIIEVILQTGLYAGFPAFTNAFYAAKHLLTK